MADLDGNVSQTRVIMDQVADTAILRFAASHPEMSTREADIPAPLKWAAAIIAALFTAGIATLAGWLVFTVSDMQVTLARMDERQSFASSALDSRFGEMDRRITKLEAYHATGAN